MKKIIFRVDSGNHIGVGHVMRCLTLARELKQYTTDITFISKDHLGHIGELVQKEFSLFLLSGGVKKQLAENEKADYKQWIGTSPEEDLLQTNEMIDRLGGCDLFIVDHYAVDETYEKKIRAKKIMVIDDLFNRKHDCDLLLDQNITARKENYASLVPSRAKELLGPQYALLRKEFKTLRSQVKSENFKRLVKVVVVFFGGADEDGLSLKLAQSLGPVLNQYEFHFVLNKNHKDFDELSQLLSAQNKAELHTFVKDFGELMLKADLFIGAGGTTSWERASLGVASAIVAVAENQMGNCLELHKTENSYFLGRSSEMKPQDWLGFFSKIVPDESLWYRYRKNSFALVDALGTEKVGHEIEKMLC